MKKIKSIYFLVTSAIIFGYQPVAFAEDYKLGVVNALRVLEQSPQADAARKLIEKEFAPRDKQIVAEQKKLKESEDKLAKDGAIMSESERKNLERDYINQKRDLKRNQDEFREDFNFRRNEEFSKIQKEIVDAIQKVAIENNYDVVLSEGVIYASPKTDMTPQVIEYLKKQQSTGSTSQ